MSRITFDSQGKLIGVDGVLITDHSKSGVERVEQRPQNRELKRSSDLQFLQENPKKENIFDSVYWSLHSKKGKLSPLRFSNKKTQEDVVKEIVELIREGSKIIFLHGTCGTGKSAIALNIARILGRASIVVPVKALQRQYEEDYMKDKYLVKNNGEKMKIAMITGRENHDSIFLQGRSCADPFLPENIKLTEKNHSKILEYYEDNPMIKNKSIKDAEKLRRLSIAPANPYWSPILPSDFEVNQLGNSAKYNYKGADGKQYTFYHRRKGCSYYDQYLSYVLADVIIFNSAKYKAELSIGRKPLTDVEIIDEADEFLDSLFQQEELNLTRVKIALRSVLPENIEAAEQLNKIRDLIDLEEKNKRATGVDDRKVFHIDETKVRDILRLFTSNANLEAEIALDELNYANTVLETAKNFEGAYEDIYLTYKKDEEQNLYVKLVSTNLSAKLKDLMNKTKALVFMSGTLHSRSVLEKIFGIKDFKIVMAETSNFGNIEIIRTGKEIDCKYSNFSSKRHSREDYLGALEACFKKDVMPSLIHVFSFQDLPNELEKSSLFLDDVMSFERLSLIQREDKTGKSVSLFKAGLSTRLFTTKCSRGVDFPGGMCNSVIFTKYPNPNISDTFWKILQKTHPESFWDFYKDKARREFLQRIYRALRSPEDHVYILSPDSRVLDAVQELQRGRDSKDLNITRDLNFYQTI